MKKQRKIRVVANALRLNLLGQAISSEEAMWVAEKILDDLKKYKKNNGDKND